MLVEIKRQAIAVHRDMEDGRPDELQFWGSAWLSRQARMISAKDDLPRTSFCGLTVM